MNRALLACVLVMLAAVLSGCGDEGTTIVNSETTTAAGITVAGTGIVYGAPDIVTLRLGASVTAPSVAQAREQAAVSMQTVINSLKANGVADKDIQTTGLSISPQYEFTGRTQTLRGYQVSNLVTAKIRKIDSAGKSIDDATAAGGNDVVVQGISFSIDDPTRLREQARELAVKEARTRAGELAQHAGVSLGKPISIVETSSSASPLPYAAEAMSRVADTSTPVSAGELQVIINVTIVYAID